MPAQTVIKFRRDTAANWTTANPVLAAGEVGLESDSGLVKYGNGTAEWADLAYTTAASIKTKVQNATGSSIPKGSVVYISGANGDNPLITLADADSEATSSKTLGITEATIANGAQGYVIESGLLTGLNTNAATAGQSVWLSSTAGQLVFGSPPAKPAHSVYLGVVTRANTNTGTILIKVQNGYELNELHDVDAGSPSSGDVLQWNGTAWVNSPVAVSEVTGLQTALDAKAALESPTFTGTVSGVTKAHVGLGNVDNTTDANKPVSTATQTALDLKANLAAPTFTGNVVLPSTTTIGDVSAAEILTLDGVTSSVQTQLNARVEEVNGAVTTAATNLTVVRNITLSTAEPTGGMDGDVWLKYTV